jgi:hypothetical protein
VKRAERVLLVFDHLHDSLGFTAPELYEARWAMARQAIAEILGGTEAAERARRDADHGEALREDWARRAVAAAGHSWPTHMAKFDGTVLPR